MNERIKELTKQAAKELADAGHNTDTALKMFPEKFAELIVRECCDILTDNVEVALNASGSPVYPEGLIREHFGVEE